MTTSLVTDHRMTTSGNFTQGGNGKYKPLFTKKKDEKSQAGVYDPFNPAYDRMRFKNSRDPIFIAFDHVDKMNPVKLTADLIKEGVTSSITTIGKTLVTLFN